MVSHEEEVHAPSEGVGSNSSPFSSIDVLNDGSVVKNTSLSIPSDSHDNHVQKTTPPQEEISLTSPIQVIVQDVENEHKEEAEPKLVSLKVA